MPSKNILKRDANNTFYHVYARGVNKQPIFLDDQDNNYFVNLFSRYLSAMPATSKTGILYPHYYHDLELTTYCLMKNHFHLLIYQKQQGSMTAFMRSILTSYSRYFNLRYERRGPLFESRYKASSVTSEQYLMHISRYIHLNPRNWKRYRFSSFAAYSQESCAEWLQPQRILDLFEDSSDYARFVADYEAHRDLLKEIKRSLADA